VADLEAVRAAAEPVVAGFGLELVDVEVVGSGRARTLRLTVDRPGAPALLGGSGVGRDELAAASERVSEALDSVAALPGPYTLEVSSPGLERPLRRPREFQRFVGTTVSVKSHEAVSGARRHRGQLVEADDDGVTLEVDGERRRLPYEGIAQARTVFEWGPAPKPGKANSGKSSKRGAGRASAPRRPQPAGSEERLT
jgi:ribosome maturation factor RimP